MQHQLYLLFTPSLCRGEPWSTLRAALAGGVDLVQWRAETVDRDAARRCMAICAEHGVPVIVNDAVDLAAELGAHGAHVGQQDMPARQARQRLATGQVLGVSTHDLEQLARAVADGADHVGFGPMFPTTTKGYAIGQRPGTLRAVLAASPVPVWPIGGITIANLAQLSAEGATRVAVSRAVLDAHDPCAAATELRAALARGQA